MDKNPYEELNASFTEKNLKLALRSLKNNKAIGQDLIHRLPLLQVKRQEISRSHVNSRSHANSLLKLKTDHS